MSETAKMQTDKHPRTGRLLRIVIPLALIPIALIHWRIFAQKPRARAVAPEVVTIAQATSGDMPVILNELGTVTPTATVTVVPNQAVSGYLTEVPFKEGQDVEKDQLLAQIDPRPYQAALDHFGEIVLGNRELDRRRLDRRNNGNSGIR